MERSSRGARHAGRAAALSSLVLWLLAAAGCGKPPAVQGTVLLGNSRSGAEVFRLSLPSGSAARTFALPAPCGDLSRGPGGEIYLASSREVLQLREEGDLAPLLRVEERIDTVLPSRDGARLFILEHPPGSIHGAMPEPAAAAEKPAEAAREKRPSERAAPHRLRIWDLRASRFQGEVELDPLGYEIHEAPGQGLILATHLKGRRLEIARVGPEGFLGDAAETIEFPEPGGGSPNRQALFRAAAVEPGGRWALIVENGVGGDFQKGRLWTLDLSSRALRSFPFSARGLFQDGILFLRSDPRGAARAVRAVLNGRDRLVAIEGSPEEGFREGPVIPLPGLFHDPRRIEVASPDPGAPAAELLLLAGSDARRERGLLAAVDPARALVAWTWNLPGTADVLEIEPPLE